MSCEFWKRAYHKFSIRLFKACDANFVPVVKIWKLLFLSANIWFHSSLVKFLFQFFHFSLNSRRSTGFVWSSFTCLCLYSIISSKQSVFLQSSVVINSLEVPVVFVILLVWFKMNFLWILCAWVEAASTRALLFILLWPFEGAPVAAIVSPLALPLLLVLPPLLTLPLRLVLPPLLVLPINLVLRLLLVSPLLLVPPLLLVLPLLLVSPRFLVRPLLLVLPLFLVIPLLLGLSPLLTLPLHLVLPPLLVLPINLVLRLLLVPPLLLVLPLLLVSPRFLVRPLLLVLPLFLLVLLLLWFFVFF